MSAIADIYASIALWGLGTNVRNIDEIKNNVNAGDCPIRILLPFTEGEQHFVTLGNRTIVEWRIRDLYLCQPVLKGAGIEQCAASLVQYLANYADNLKSSRSPTVKSFITSISYRMGTYPWGQTDYWGIEITISVSEEL